jgi:Fe-S-cluster containining protein
MDRESEFCDAYGEATTATVFWCPTIDNPDFASVGHFHGREKPKWEGRTVATMASALLIGYLQSFEALRFGAKGFDRLFAPIVDAAVGSFDGGGRFLDLAQPRAYGGLVGKFGRPIRAHPSFGFWFDLADQSSFDDLDVSLGFQVEATYATKSLAFDQFFETCARFVRECGQEALRVLLDGTAWQVRNLDGEAVPSRAGTESIWSLEMRPNSEIVPLLAQDRLRFALTNRSLVTDPLAHRWLRQAQLRGSSESFGATIVLAPDGNAAWVRISGYSHWLFEALFPTIVSRPYHDSQQWRWHEPPDPILMSADLTGDDDARLVRAAMYQAEPEGDLCLCGDMYPSHSGPASVVALRLRAQDWIRRVYACSPRSVPEPVTWETLSSPQTYFDLNPADTFRADEGTSRREEVRAGANLAWRNLMNTVFEAAPLPIEFPAERASLSMTAACNACSDICCHSGSPLVTAAERERIVGHAGFEDFFVPVPNREETYWIGKTRDGQERQFDSAVGRFTDWCPYYESGSGCLIHQWKPLDCVLYPLRPQSGHGLRTAIQCPSRAMLTIATEGALTVAAFQQEQIAERTDEAEGACVGSWSKTEEAGD